MYYLGVKILCVCALTIQMDYLREKLNFLLMTFAFVKELTILPLIYYLFLQSF